MRVSSSLHGWGGDAKMIFFLFSILLFGVIKVGLYTEFHENQCIKEPVKGLRGIQTGRHDKTIRVPVSDYTKTQNERIFHTIKTGESCVTYI